MVELSRRMRFRANACTFDLPDAPGDLCSYGISDAQVRRFTASKELGLSDAKLLGAVYLVPYAAERRGPSP
jgi:hypothetical protein